MSCISYEVHDLVQSLSHQSGNDMLIKLKDHVVPRLLENIKSFIISDHHFESSATMTEDQLVKLLGVLLVNLHYLPKVRAELLWPSRTQYELLQNVFGNLRDFHGLKVNRCIERKTIEYFLPQFQLMAERVGHFCFVLLSYQLNKTDEKDEDGLAKTDKKNEEYELPSQFHSSPSTFEDNSDFSRGHYSSWQIVCSLGTYWSTYQRGNLEENSRNEENMKETSSASLDLLEDIDVLKEDLKNVFLKVHADSSQLCFPMAQEKISKNTSTIFANSPNKPVENKSAIAGKIIVGYKEETEWIIQKLTSGPSELDTISIVRMLGLGKTTLAYKVYTEKAVVDHFDIRTWYTVEQERNEKNLLQKIFNQIISLKGRVGEDAIDDDVADKLQKYLFRKSDPLDLRLLSPEESWELLEKRVFGEECCHDKLKDVGDKIVQKCGGLPLVLDLIGGVISRKEKKEALWLEVLNNLSFFCFKDEKEVMKVIQLSFDHLSDHLKSCLIYLASYPKDEDIWIYELKELWSIEGLVEPTDLKSVEEVMEVYMDELISSSLVIFFK
ncbi:hypothetical protein CQW23_12802 [Capsicum baccatum]|uniref:NB-ARC domain-containing protein n=1 Tax=Capsicum baccatum TaxID=33114 RepID=A0A2G2WTM7_CAPBA|nr:hypothetical protein CQW23_12802 [Capsicum baccatum]